MKNRRVKYGYAYQNGVITVNPTESTTVKRIFDLYINGLSLIKIVQLLIAENIEYMVGEVSWNKGKIKRIIDDDIYTGTDTYPPVISKDTFEKANKVKSARDTQKGIDRSSDIYNLNVPILCAECGSQLKRNRETRCVQGTRWICKNSECHKIIHLMRDDGTVDMNKLSDKLQIKDGQEKLSIKKYRYSSSSEAQVSDIPEDKKTVNTADDNSSDEPDWERTSLKPSEEAIVRELEENGEIDVQLSGENGDEPKQGDLHLPTEKTGRFLGEKGNSEFMPNSKTALEKMIEYGKNTVEYKDGYPDFSPFTEHNTEFGKLKCEVEIPHMTDQRENPSWEYGRRPRGTAHNPNNDLGNFAQADNALLLKMQELNPNATVNDVVQFRKDNQLTWHECADGKTMQLVPQAIHDACRHSGGVSEMKYRMAWGSYYKD